LNLISRQMVKVKLMIGSEIIFDLLVGIGVLRGTLEKLGDYVQKKYHVISYESKTPTNDDPTSEFVFKCTEGEIKITTEI